MPRRLLALALVPTLGCAEAPPAPSPVVARPALAPAAAPPVASPAVAAILPTLSGFGGDAEICAVLDAKVACTKSRIEIPEPVRGLSLGSGEIGCAVGQSGSIYCWGKNDKGQLGIGHVSASEPPTRVPLPRPAIDIALQSSESCAVDDEGSLWCWSDLARPLGPARVDTRLPVRDIADCMWNTCGVLRDGSLFVVGATANRETGEIRPVAIPMLDSAGFDHAAFAHWTQDQYAVCGVRDHRIGCATTEKYPTSPGEILSSWAFNRFNDIRTFSIYQVPACAITLDGALECLAKGGVARVPGMTGVREVHLSVAHTCVRLGDRDIRCFARATDGDPTPYDPFAPGAPRRY